MAAAHDAPMEWREFVVAPQVELKGKVYWCVHPVDDSKATAFFEASQKALRGLAVGQRYKIETDGHNFRFQSREWLGYDPDDERRNAYQAEQKAFDLKRKAAALEAKEGSGDAQLVKALEPLRLAYQKLPTPARLPFELWVLSVLRRKT